MTSTLSDLFKVPVDVRDLHWHDDFYTQVVNESFVPGDPDAMVGPDHFPYTILFTPPERTSRAVPLKTLIEEATVNGTGIVLNPRANGADWVFGYGNLWSYRAFGSFFIPSETPIESGPLVLEKDTKILVGSPSEMFFPSYARRVIGDYMAQAFHISNPGVAILGPLGDAPASVAFTIFREDFPSEEAYETAMRRMTWFLPSHYVITGLPKSQEIDYTPL